MPERKRNKAKRLARMAIGALQAAAQSRAARQVGRAARAAVAAIARAAPVSPIVTSNRGRPQVSPSPPALSRRAPIPPAPASPPSSIRWLKDLVEDSKIGKIGRKVGSQSANGIVFRCDDHPTRLVKITLTSPQIFMNELNGFIKAHGKGNPINIYNYKNIIVSDAHYRKLKELFRSYSGGDAYIGVIVMDDFFAGENILDKGSYYDFAKKYGRNPEAMKMMHTTIHRTIKNIYPTRHGDLHGENILYKIINGVVTIGIIDFGYSYEGNIRGYSNFSRVYTNRHGRTVWPNINNPAIGRVENTWYLNHTYRI